MYMYLLQYYTFFYYSNILVKSYPDILSLIYANIRIGYQDMIFFYIYLLSGKNL